MRHHDDDQPGSSLGYIVLSALVGLVFWCALISAIIGVMVE